MSYAVGDRVIVNSALDFATVVDVSPSGLYYTVEFPDGFRLWRHESELTVAS